MEYGVTPTGFARKPFAAILDSIRARTRVLLSAPLLTLDDLDPFGAIIHAASEELDLVWQGLEAAYYSNDPQNAEDFLLFALGGQSGVEQLPPQKGSVECTINLGTLKTFGPGELIAHVEGDPANRWVNRDTVSSTSAGDYEDIVFESESTGSLYSAPAGSLTVIAQRVAGWNSITNPADALPGKDAESADDFRVRREESLAISGSASPGGVRSDVAEVDGVIQVRVVENDTDAPVGSLPAHSLQVIVWDGSPSQANDNEIAQAILDSKAGGIAAYGTTDSGTAIDANGDEVTVDFDRAVVTPLYCEVEVVAPNGADEDAIKAAIQGKVPTTLGTKLVFIGAKAAVLEVAGVEDINVFALDDVDPPVNTSANLVPDTDEIYLLDSGDIDVTIVSS